MTDQRTTYPDGNSVLAAEYVLGVLTREQRDAVTRRLLNDPALQRAVQYWEESLSGIADAIPPETPSANVFSRIEERLFGRETQNARTSFRNSLGLWRGLAAASMTAAIVLALWSPLRDGQPQDDVMVAQVAGTESDVKLAAYYDATTGELRVNRVAGTAVAGRSYELWLIAGQDAPVSLGVLPESNTARIAVPANLRGKFANAVLAISDEPAGGSPTGLPTGAVLATGQLTDI
jgi:anti-sigma-K factor RskA